MARFEEDGGSDNDLDDDFQAQAPDTTLLEKAKNVNFSNKSEAEDFFTVNRGEFAAQDPSQRNIFHEVAETSVPDKSRLRWYLAFLDCLFDNYGSLLKSTAEEGLTPLHSAFNKWNTHFVRRAMANQNIKNIGQIFEMRTSSGENVLCFAIKCCFKGTKDMIERCLPSTLAFENRDVHGNTLLHRLVVKGPPPKASTEEWEILQLSLVKQLISVHREALTSRNKAGNTPFQERLAFLEDKVPGDSIVVYIKEFCMCNLSREDTIEALYRTGEERQIEFDLAGLPNPTIPPGYLKSLSAHLKFESILKYVALPSLSFEMDDGSITKRSSSYGRDTKDMAKESSNHTTARKGRKGRQKGLTNMQIIFDWLRERGVQKIIKVIIVDNGDVAHSDEAIENCLKGFDVEIWNWKRVDLGADVIQYAAGTSVKEISLYSSGNNAVLTGWSGPDGLGCPEKFPKGLENKTRLKRNVDIFTERLKTAFQAQKESQIQTLQQELDALRGQLNKEKSKPDRDPQRILQIQKKLGVQIQAQKILQAKKDIQVYHLLDTGPHSYAGSFATLNSNQESEHAWLKVMEQFAECILGLPDDPKQHIKIAVIDDGVDASLSLFEGKIASGSSFCPYPNSKDLISPYFVPSGTLHGTIMAYLICKICPRVRLYVARLDEGYAVHGKRQITARSAAAAIRWAVKCGVDIISMSWTIDFFENSKPNGDTSTKSSAFPLGDLRNAINDAADKKILMFGAASDQGSDSNICYPAKSENVIAIGAATETGEMCTWVHHGQADFTCPGYQVPFKRGDGTPSSPQNGSSVATAIAAGLAGLILYCDRIASGKEDGRLKSKDGMFDAFCNMSSMAGDRRFPRVSEFFNVERSEVEHWTGYTEEEDMDEGNGNAQPSLSGPTKKKLDDILTNLKKPHKYVWRP
ncbi:hypothetical protein TWF730_000186 [Orbilia blumenaviensis]|uniref:Peptidase S8/S53 domain-containing protein n=1 Tax=Orbilia blumenaviensis TaxID=1796055 RepID=A0AAV9VMX8_9PEZI